jgi:hypothetical protein
MADTLGVGFVSGGARRLRQLAGGLVGAIGLALLAFVALNLAQDASLWVLGRRAEAQVVDAWIEQDAEERAEAPAYRWFIRYQFQTPGGRIVAGVSRISAQELAALGHTAPVDVVYAGEDSPRGGGAAIEDGGRVDVVYLPAYPSHNRLDESRLVPVLACAYVPLILLGCAGLAIGRSLLHQT